MKITKEMVNELNSKLEENGSVVIFEFKDDGPHSLNPMIKLRLKNMTFVESFVLNMTKEFYNYVGNFFAKYNIELDYNNTYSVAWSNDWS